MLCIVTAVLPTAGTGLAHGSSSINFCLINEKAYGRGFILWEMIDETKWEKYCYYSWVTKYVGIHYSLYLCVYLKISIIKLKIKELVHDIIVSIQRSQDSSPGLSDSIA